MLTHRVGRGRTTARSAPAPEFFALETDERGIDVNRTPSVRIFLAVIVSILCR